MRFLVDMNLSPQWVVWLQEAGHEATHWSQVGRGDAPDDVIMTFAVEKGAVVFTHDLDFGTMLARSGATSPSIIQVREQEVDPGVVGPAVLAAIEQCREPLERGALVTVDLRRAKARILPIPSKGQF